jgi:hypothetical protein
MIRFVVVAVVFLFFIGCASTPKKYNERHYQTLLCNELDGKMEYVLEDKTRVDCLTQEYAIEVDFAKKWAEGIGQSLYYANMTGKKPAIGLIMNKEKDQRYFKRLNKIAKQYEIKIFMLERVSKGSSN